MQVRKLIILFQFLLSQASVKELLLLLLFLCVGMLFFASLIYYTDDRAVFPSIPHACWWSIITMTTVGYGDVSPSTELGYFVGSMTAVCGVLVIGFTVPVLVNNFILYYQHTQCALTRDGAKRKREKVKEWRDTSMHHHVKDSEKDGGGMDGGGGGGGDVGGGDGGSGAALTGQSISSARTHDCDGEPPLPTNVSEQTNSPPSKVDAASENSVYPNQSSDAVTAVPVVANADDVTTSSDCDVKYPSIDVTVSENDANDNKIVPGVSRPPIEVRVFKAGQMSNGGSNCNNRGEMRTGIDSNGNMTSVM
jgi:hypothetical protein